MPRPLSIGYDSSATADVSVPFAPRRALPFCQIHRPLVPNLAYTPHCPLPTLFRYHFFCAEPVARGVVVKTLFRPILAANSLAIRLLDRMTGVPPSRGSERLTQQGTSVRPTAAPAAVGPTVRHPLAEQRANRYSASGPEGGCLPRHHRRGPIEARARGVESYTVPAVESSTSSIDVAPLKPRSAVRRDQHACNCSLPRHHRRGPIEAAPVTRPRISRQSSSTSSTTWPH